MEMKIEQKAKAWDKLKLIVSRAISDESESKELRSVMEAFKDLITDVENSIIKKDSKNDGATGA